MMILIRILSAFIPSKKWRNWCRHELRNKIYSRSVIKRAAYVGKNLYIGDHTSVNNKTKIGDSVGMYDLSILGDGEVIIGNHVIFGPHITIQTQNHNYKGELLPFDYGFECKPVRIDDCVWIGMNVQILPGTHICEGAIIQMGSVVHGEIPPCAIAGGNPAKVFAYRDKDLYYKLKAGGRFIS